MGWLEVWQVMSKHCRWYLRHRSIFNFRPSILSPWQLVPPPSERLLGPLMSLYRVHGGANGSIWYQTLTQRVAICHQKGPTLALLLTPFNPFLPIRLNLHGSSFIRAMFFNILIKTCNAVHCFWDLIISPTTSWQCHEEDEPTTALTGWQLVSGEARTVDRTLKTPRRCPTSN